MAGEDDVAPFFAHRAGDWKAVDAARERRPVPPLDADAVEELLQANREWGVADFERAEHLKSPETRVVMTGQQPGLLGGPMFTMYKAIAAVRWAERIERERGAPTVPMFWVASEDHDFDEIRWLRWLDSEGNWRRYEYDANMHQAGLSVHDVPVGAELQDDLLTIIDETRQTEFTPDIRDWLSDLVAKSFDLESLFVRVLSGLLGERVPLFVSPRMRWVRERARPVLEREIGNPGESTRQVIEAGERLKDQGFEAAIHRKPDDVNAFLYRDRLRCKITREGGRFAITKPSGDRGTETRENLCAELKTAPGNFSLNVVTRPIVSDAILPTLAYVAGPGEVAYLAQLRSTYEFFDVEPSMILPRPQASLLEPRVERALAKIGLDASVASFETDAEFADAAEKAVGANDSESELQEAREKLVSDLEELKAAVDVSEPSVARAFEKLSQATELGIEKLFERHRHALLSRNETIQRAVETVRDSLWPDGVLQERAVTMFFPFLNLFGKGLALRLFDAIDIDRAGVQPISISSILSEGK